MTKARGYTRRRPSSDARARAWTSMRILRNFTVPQLQMTAAISEANIFVYVRCLVRAGYLRIVKERELNRPGSRSVYQLVRNTGPLQPIPQRSGEVYDPNVREVFGQPKCGSTKGNIVWLAAPRSEQSRHATTEMRPQAIKTIDRDRVLESDARRAAKGIGLILNKGRGRLSDNNRGGFALIDPVEGRIVAGKKFDLTLEEVTEILEIVEDIRRLVPEQRRRMRRLAIRMLTRQIDQERAQQHHSKLGAES